MVVIVEFSVPSDSFKFGSMLSIDSETEVDVEQLVPVGDNVMPFSWASGNTGLFEEGLEENSIPYTVILEDDHRGRKLYKLEWDSDNDELIQAILGNDGSVLDATGTSEKWTFRVRFREREDLSGFHTQCSKADLNITVNRIYNPIEVSGNSHAGMTLVQTETLIDAFEAGYFDVPRKTSLVELAEKYEVSDQAVSERLRRATATLIESSLVKDKENMNIKELKN